MRLHAKPLFLVLFLFGLSGCAVSTSEMSYLKQEIETLKQENAAIKEALTSETAPNGGGLAKVEKKVSNLNIDIKQTKADGRADNEMLRAEMSKLSGRIDETNHSIKQASASSSGFIENADARMSKIENRIARVELQTAALERAREAEKKAAKKRVAPIQEKPKKSAKQFYKEGYNALKKGKRKTARTRFREYLKYYPDGPLANNAQFWIGESYYRDKNFERAIVEYNEVLNKYPKGGKVPAAKLKQAMSFVRMGDRKTGDALYRKLIEAHPKTEEAGKARKILKGRKKKKSTKKTKKKKK